MLEVAGGCTRCRRGRGCGLSLTRSRQHLWVPDEPSWQLGQRVDLAPPVPLRRIAARAYGPPLLGLLAGAVLGAFGSQIGGLTGGPSDGVVGLGAASGLAAAFFLSRVQHRSALPCSVSGEGSLK